MAIESIRHRLGRLSIQTKLLVINLTATATALFFAVLMTIYSEYSNSRDSVLESLLVQAKMVGNNTTAALVFDDPEGAKDILQAFSVSKNVQAAVIYDENNGELARYIRHQSDVTSNNQDLLETTDYVIDTSKINEGVDFILDEKDALLTRYIRERFPGSP